MRRSLIAWPDPPAPPHAPSAPPDPLLSLVFLGNYKCRSLYLSRPSICMAWNGPRTRNRNRIHIGGSDMRLLSMNDILIQKMVSCTVKQERY